MSMSMTPETPTPETDAAARRGAYIKAPSLYYETHGKQLVHIDDARRLERERDAARAENEAMREAIRETASHLSGFLGFHADVLSLDQVKALSATLAKLKPFIPDATPAKP